jgi:hypothetical protein
VEAQRRGGRRSQAPRRGRQEAAAAAGYAAPGDVPVYGAASDAVPVYGAASSDPALEALAGNIPGVPGEDYPIFAEVPESAFTCEGQVDGGLFFLHLKLFRLNETLTKMTFLMQVIMLILRPSARLSTSAQLMARVV